MPTKDDFPAIFKKLRAILKKHEKDCIAEMDTETDYFLNTKKLDQRGKPIFLGGVSVNKISVSFYLLPVYTFPDLLDGLSSELHARKHGKSCFRFKAVEPSLFKELAGLTKKSVERSRIGSADQTCKRTG